MSPPSNAFKVDIKAPIQPVTDPPEQRWTNYIRGVMALFPSSYPAFDALVSSNVPLGGGLSSSASLEVAVARLLQALTPENRYIR